MVTNLNLTAVHVRDLVYGRRHPALPRGAIIRLFVVALGKNRFGHVGRVYIYIARGQFCRFRLLR